MTGWMRYAALSMTAALLTGCAVTVPESPVKFPTVAAPFARPANVKQTMLFRPAGGAGPFPAVVLLPTCGGMEGHVIDWAERFVSAGYVVLTVESFVPRGTANNCNAQPATKYDDVTKDAALALTHLRTLSFVDGDRLALMGFSFGANAGLRLSSASYVKQMGLSVDGLRAIASVYPRCYPVGQNFVRPGGRLDNLIGDVAIPTMLFLGAIDDETPSIECVTRVDRFKAQGKPISYKVYPDTTHAYDSKTNGLQGRYVVHERGRFFYRYSPDATEDTWREAKAMFDRELKGTK